MTVTQEPTIVSISHAAKTVGIDVDSVLADVMLIWTDEYSKRSGRKISKSQIINWDIPTVVPLSPEEVYDLFSYVWKHRWQEIPATEPQIGKVTEMMHKKGYRISVITKRERPTVPYVAMWLDRHQVYADEMVFVYDAVPKANYPFDILIDDAPKNLVDITAPKSAILFNQPWNSNFRWSPRVNSLSEAEALL